MLFASSPSQQNKMTKGKSLPPALKQLLKEPTFPARTSKLSSSSIKLPAGRSAGPLGAPKESKLFQTFQTISDDAQSKGLGWGEWLSFTTATLVTLNSPKALQSLHRHAVNPSSLSIEDRIARACLMREVGLKCIGFIGIPKVINQLAALRAAVDEDAQLKDALPKEARRKVTAKDTEAVQKAAYALWDDIYTPVSDRLIDILGQSHPDLPVFIVDGEYGPLFSIPSTFSSSSALKEEPIWEVNRLRTSLVAMAGLRAQGGVGPQVTSHVWGLLKASKSIREDDINKKGLQWLTTEEGALWTVRMIDHICEAVEGGAQEEEEAQQGQSGRDSKL